MQAITAFMFGLLLAFLAPGQLYAQAIGEYGRTVEGAGRRQGSGNQKASQAPSRSTKDKSVVEGMREVKGRPVPSTLVVVSSQAVLYPRQDPEAEKMAELSQGETLVLMGQSNGGNDWYMVKTPKGLVGWIKSVDVRAEPATKP
jgi:hypothetical protein